ncbi:3-hydroxy-3-methylglutaryl-CoA lyase [Sphingopyxis sp. H038]|uniref:hydroxymethylglutaryl-CoA lyase n=1 Tax=unclassified Sphingopyxis TaxID=2614943 RepID=UPI0007300623|nr:MULTISPECIES: hydroxymethylglutaryl-CoA lyase [unclassified Sphingopyxis]KTD99966.1 3-hydroxy-3-methylglutaryl-CoA lyase [Sphingopyxis sp. H012]KTE07151.1 3-hydroxy-3-methylglutaryl-CoA lyase [Sphingopyxis sp. H053]KTE09022.1 3-hydroxy-3-methylglutaryl-CoA lyase [Sphingopyxis sp. H093]KTE25300.1 3-hydroxy-3-methylglutaryl-CoA lyase [Sphingopyxis sp. H080]KTE36322.1 3-hydroxy-3-methylglutaryl-CoA lyase [Sphingopyxis sp. H038]
MLKNHAVELVEVGPRDGLQNEAAIVSTADKLELIRRAIDYGVRRIEVTSFVNPKKVPQLADAEELVAMLPDRDDVTWIGLVLNRRGAERALATGRIDELGAVCVTSDSFGIRNQGQSSDESLAAAMEIVALAKAAGRSGQITIATAFGCPFEGKVAIDRVVEMAKRAADASPREIALADTIGVGVPAQVSEMVGRVREAVGDLPVRVHFHNTRGTGVANVWAAVNEGAATVDASLGGLGGCPFAPGAAGNVATEDVIYMLEQCGIRTGVTLPQVVEAAGWLTGVMGRPLPAMVSKAPAFP